jgi:hypothetical protein
VSPVEVGLEHEFAVAREGKRVDFRKLIHPIDLPGRAIDPGDKYAYRLETGAVVTCDDAEAEAATPPVALEPGWATALREWATSAATSLIRAVPDASLSGWSTHLSVSADTAHVAQACGLFSRTFAPALMMLMEQRNGEGLLMRPRWCRLEFGGDYVSGAALSAATAMAAGGALVCLDVARGQQSKRALPPAVKVDVTPAVERYGWFVDRKAFGFDLLEQGRQALFRREYFGSIGAQRQLEVAWAVAREAIVAVSSEHDLSAADAMVAGDRALPLEQQPNRAPMVAEPSVARKHPLGSAVALRTEGDLEVSAIAVTWDYVVFGLSGAENGVWAVPRRDLPEAIARIREGDVSPMLAEYRRDEPLGSYDQAVRGGFYTELLAGRRLAPPEPGRDGKFRLAASSPA